MENSETCIYTLFDKKVIMLTSSVTRLHQLDIKKKSQLLFIIFVYR